MWYVILVLFLTTSMSMLAYVIGAKFSVLKKNNDIKQDEYWTTAQRFVDMDETGIRTMAEKAPFACLCISRDLIIEKTANQAADKMFATSVINQRISEIIFEKQPVLQETFDIMLTSLFEAEDETSRQKVMQLLPDKMVYYDKTFQMAYHYEAYDGLYLYLTDLTNYARAKDEADKRNAELEMVIQVLKNQKNYIELKMQMNRVLNEEFEHIFAFGEDVQTIKKLLRHRLHALMLSAVSLSLRNSVSMIEHLEEVLDKLPNDMSVIQMRDKLYSHGIAKIMDEDKKILASYIDEEKLDARYFTVDNEAVSEIESMINGLEASPTKDALLSRIRTIRFVGIVDIISRFDKYAFDLAKKLNKKVYPIHYIGEKVLIDEDLFKDIIVGFIELVTNAVDHGIEFPAERFRMGKPEHGNLTMKLEIGEEGYTILFSDDGRGIDVNAIKNNLYETKRFPFDEIVTMHDDEVVQFIFLDGVYSMNEDAYHFNRGTGLFILKQKLEAMGGAIKVITEQNKHTTFEVYVPSMTADSSSKRSISLVT